MFRFAMAMTLALTLIAAPAQASVSFGDGGAALQGVLDTVTVGGPSSINVVTDGLPDSGDSIWAIGGSGGSVATIIVELAGFANSNLFGIYDAANPANSVQVFGGADSAGDQALISILGDGSVRINFVDTGIDFAGNNFGFYLDSSANAGGGLWYSDTALNSDGADHMAAYQGVGDLIQIPPFAAGIWGSNEYVLAFEDLDFAASDQDFTDFVVLVESINPVPEPASIIAWIGLAGIFSGVGYVRFRRNRA